MSENCYKDIYDDGWLFLDFSEKTASLNGKPLTLSPYLVALLIVGGQENHDGIRVLDINLPDGNGFELCKLIKPFT